MQNGEKMKRIKESTTLKKIIILIIAVCMLHSLVIPASAGPVSDAYRIDEIDSNIDTNAYDVSWNEPINITVKSDHSSFLDGFHCEEGVDLGIAKITFGLATTKRPVYKGTGASYYYQCIVYKAVMVPKVYRQDGNKIYSGTSEYLNISILSSMDLPDSSVTPIATPSSTTYTTSASLTFGYNYLYGRNASVNGENVIEAGINTSDSFSLGLQISNSQTFTLNSLQIASSVGAVNGDTVIYPSWTFDYIPSNNNDNTYLVSSTNQIGQLSWRNTNKVGDDSVHYLYTAMPVSISVNFGCIKYTIGDIEDYDLWDKNNRQIGCETAQYTINK